MNKRISRRPVDSGPKQFSDGLHPLLQRVYRARGVRGDDDLTHGLAQLLPPDGLSGLAEAVARLEQSLIGGDQIAIVGDYDADGATASALAVRALRAFGARSVVSLVPDRFAGGYGLSADLVEQAAQLDAGLIITVDNGISSLRGVDRAGELDIPVVVTDHHIPGEQLPMAAAIVNPNLPDDGFASKNLAGVGVIFYVLSALRKRLRDIGWFVERQLPEPSMADYLDLVALGTVADLVRLDRNNRILVEQGLRRIRAGRCVPGISALLKVAGKERERLTAGDLGFAVAPRLNAAGRLDNMAQGIECLLEDDPALALEQAAVLDGLNRERRQIETEMSSQADAAMEQLQVDGDDLPLGLCLFDERWHQGVIGILASRIKERYHRPVVALAAGEDGSVKGSARSIPGLHMRDVLAAVDSRHPDLLTRYGGHAMAAGMTLNADGVDAFAAAFDAEVCRQLDGKPPQAEVLSDGELSSGDLTESVARLLRYSGPWGQGFPEPIFDGEFSVLSQRILGEQHLKLLLGADGDVTVDAIAFRWGDQKLAGDRVRIAYRLDLNAYRGNEKPQLIIEHIDAL